MITRIGSVTACSDRQVGDDLEPSLGMVADGERAADRLDPLAHPDQAETGVAVGVLVLGRRRGHGRER